MIVDEVQKAPKLLPEIKRVLDSDNTKGQYLLTGSADIKTLPAVTESLAGRMGTIRLRPLARGEIDGKSPTFFKRAFAEDFPATVKGFDKAAILEFAFDGGYPEALGLRPRAKRQLTSALQIKHETFVRFLAILKTLYLIDEIPPWQESDDECILGIEVKSGSAIGKEDFAHLAWFRDNIVKQRRFIGIVLYTGEHTLPFGKSLYAVPMGTLCT